ncbi:MAG: phytoene desaturase family protein [Chloroflexota bacterium]
MASPQACDVLVVGGGMAGLTTAAYLAKAGLAVLLCEKEAKTGGLVNSFEFNGFVFDGGIRAIENSGIVSPMLKQLGISVDFLPSPVSIGIGEDVVWVSSRESLRAYQQLLSKNFPEQSADIDRIVQDIRRVMGYMSILYGIDNPLFLDLRHRPGYVLRTILPWLVRYALTMPRIGRLRRPVDEYLASFTTNQPLIDLIAQHFFQKTPAFFALSYFSLYLDYRYPRGGTGALSQAMERFFEQHGGQVSRKTAITRVEPGKLRAWDASGGVYQYRNLVWAADLKTLYRIIDLRSLANGKAAAAIQARQRAMAGQTGGDSVLTLYLTLNLERTYFAGKHSAHFFYTASVTGLSRCRVADLLEDGPQGGNRFVSNRPAITRWLARYLELTTYEISCPVLRDAALAPAGQTGLIVSTLFDYGLTRHIKAMGWYDEFKQLTAEHIVGLLDKSIYPGIKAAVMDAFTSTPLTIERLTGNSEGAITGWAFTNEFMPAVNQLSKVASAVRTPIPHTYQAGQWTYSPAGLPISILTGKLAADSVLKDLG